MSQKIKIAIIASGIFLIGYSVFSKPWLPRIEQITFAKPSPIPPPITMILGGDVMLGRLVNVKLHEKNDFFYPWREIAPEIQKVDLAMVNLESPIVENCPIVKSGTFKFCGDPESGKALRRAGIDVVSFANNHYLDYGSAGVSDTKKILSEESVIPLIHAEPQNKEIQGKRFGFLAYNLTWNPPSHKEIVEQVSELKFKSDLVIVSFHWGEEYQDFPSEEQKVFARKIIDAGANIVMGHHPHHLQPVEEYKNGLILYSLGNLVFDQMWSEKTRLGALVKVSWANGNLNYEILPTKIFDFAQPKFIKP